MCVQKKKIAVIGLKGLPAFGGAAAVGENIIEQLKDKYDFTVYSIASHANKSNSKINQRVFNNFPIKKLNIIYYYFASVFHVLMVGKFDLIHVHHTDISFILPFLRLKYKVVITSHGSAYKIKGIDFKYNRLTTSLLILSEKYFLRFANIITSVSNELAKILGQRHSRKVLYIPNGMNVSASFVNHSVDQKQEEYILFAAGRIIPTKGCHVFLKAIKNSGLKTKIFIIGDLEQHKSYTNEIMRLAEGLNIEFLGLIKDRIILNKYIQNAKLFVFPSSLEAMSMMLLEVAALKTPIISSSIVENKDIFSDREVLYFKTDDEVDLGLKIKFALGNYEFMQDKATKAFDKLIKMYNWKKIGIEYDRLYRIILN